MAKKDAGVFQMENGKWAYRFKMVVDGKEISRRKSTDEHGNKLLNKTDAIKAREAAMVAARTERKKQIKIVRRTFGEVFLEYRETGCKGKAYKTMLKQDSLWKNHFSKRWGKRFVDDISAAEANDYLAELYFECEYSFQYVEGFLKIFYLVFGQAYSRNYLDIDAYNKLCVNKNTKIQMPKMRVGDEKDDIVAFDRSELALLDEYFDGTNAETAYLLGRYCGLRINETYGLKWDHVDLEHGTITIDRQMQYQDGVIKLIHPKTRNARRTIYLCDRMKEHLEKEFLKRQEAEKTNAIQRRQNQSLIEDLDGSLLSCTELVHCLPNGKIQTNNSMKYHSMLLHQRGVNFKYHYLRHTYGTYIADMNTPMHLLCNQMGHGNINVTQRYYLAVSKTGIEMLRENLNQL